MADGSVPLKSYSYSPADFARMEARLCHRDVTDEQKLRMKMLEQDFSQLLMRIMESCPSSFELELAIQKLSEASFYSKKAISLE